MTQNPVSDAIDFMLKHCKDARWDLIGKAMASLNKEFLKREENKVMATFTKSCEYVFPPDVLPEVTFNSQQEDHKCTCPSINFSWNGLGCVCGGC